MDVRRRLAVVTLLVAGGAMTVPAPAVAGGGLTVTKARQVAKLYAAEICAARAPACRDFEVTTCTRLGAKKVACKTRLDEKRGETCRYTLTVKKVKGGVEGRLGTIRCS